MDRGKNNFRTTLSPAWERAGCGGEKCCSYFCPDPIHFTASRLHEATAARKTRRTEVRGEAIFVPSALGPLLALRSEPGDAAFDARR
jgi:hypothetical protein